MTLPFRDLTAPISTADSKNSVILPFSKAQINSPEDKLFLADATDPIACSQDVPNDKPCRRVLRHSALFCSHATQVHRKYSHGGQNHRHNPRSPFRRPRPHPHQCMASRNVEFHESNDRLHCLKHSFRSLLVRKTTQKRGSLTQPAKTHFNSEQ